MRFDCSPPVLSALNTRLRLDPSVLRWTTLKQGARLDQVAVDATESRTVRFARDAPPPHGEGERPEAWQRV